MVMLTEQWITYYGMVLPTLLFFQLMTESQRYLETIPNTSCSKILLKQDCTETKNVFIDNHKFKSKISSSKKVKQVYPDKTKYI